MDYALVKNISLRNLLAPDGKVINWTKYGYTVQSIQGFMAQGYDSLDEEVRNHITVLPIIDRAKYDATLPELQNRIDTNLFPNDSIEVITEAEADTLKETIATVKLG